MRACQHNPLRISPATADGSDPGNGCRQAPTAFVQRGPGFMRSAQWLIVVLGVFGSNAEAPAQGLAPFGFRGLSLGGGLSISRGPICFPSPYGLGFGAACPPYYYPGNSVTLFYYAAPPVV